MFGKSSPTQETSWLAIDRESALIDKDIAMYELGDGSVRTVTVVGHLTDGRMILQQGVPGVRRGSESFDIYMRPAHWRFVGGYRRQTA